MQNKFCIVFSAWLNIAIYWKVAKDLLGSATW